ncbi:hypothetical protein KKI17_01970 [Patescibacteria group bacterium]|nr:hypothetical protein [Patescibacteria group bacterium]
MKDSSQYGGVALYITVMVLVVLLAIAAGMSQVFFQQTQILREAGYSVVAFYAADTGIEEVLKDRNGTPTDIPDGVVGSASYEVVVTPSGGVKPDDTVCDPAGTGHYCIKSTGKYQNVRRAIEITF